MEPNRLEQEFKNKLEQRTIQPSEMAWDRVDAMLSVTEETGQPKKNIKRWLYMVAGFVIFFLVGAGLLLNMESKTDKVNTNTVVGTEKPATAKQNSKEEETKAVPVSTIQQNDAVAVHATNSAKEGAGTQKTTKVSAIKTVQNSSAVAVQQQEVAVAIPVQAAQQSELIVAQNGPANNAPVQKKKGVKVDPGSLLSSVEGELDESFRSQMLESVVKNYNTVKTSVANRNYNNR